MDLCIRRSSLLILGPLVGFFGIGFFSGFAAIASEIFPCQIRANRHGIELQRGPWSFGRRTVRGGSAGGSFRELARRFLCRPART